MIVQGYQILFHAQVQTTKPQGQNSQRWIEVLRLCGRWFQRHHEMRLAERFQQCLKDIPSAAGNWSLLGALPRNAVSWCHGRFAIYEIYINLRHSDSRAPVHGIHSSLANFYPHHIFFAEGFLQGFLKVLLLRWCFAACCAIVRSSFHTMVRYSLVLLAIVLHINI